MEPEVNLAVKYGKDSLQITLSASCKLSDLMKTLEERTGLMARKQKLMFKGKVVSGQPTASLSSCGIGNGAKLMLLAAAGEPVQSAGAAALASAQRQRADALAARRAALGMAAAKSAAPAAMQPGGMAARAAAWAKTGIASVRDMQLAALPEELLAPAVAPAIRVLDAGGNHLAALPADLSRLTGLLRLRLSSNALADAGLDWRVLGALSQLSVLALDSNHLTALPASIVALPALSLLSVARNQLPSLPAELGMLTRLRSLSLSRNRLAALPPALGCCTALEELDATDNLLTQLPVELSRLTSLKVLLLDKNKLGAVPPEVLAGCSSLATLSLHDNPITAEQLRETPGYLEFNARRTAKYDKAIGMKLATSFDEGADIELFEHYKT